VASIQLPLYRFKISGFRRPLFFRCQLPLSQCPDLHHFYQLFSGLLRDQVFTAHIAESFLSHFPRFLAWHLAFAHREDINLASSTVAICF
jgi:hypothetical protein